MKRFLFIISSVFVLLSCQKEGFEGELIGLASKNFKVVEELSVSENTVDFTVKDSVEFTAKFNEAVSYTITLTGTVSGATQELKGVSKNINHVWIGNAQLVFFNKEKVNVELSILGISEPVGELVLEIKETYQPEGIQLANFELSGTFASCWFPGSNELACNAKFDSIPALEGDFTHLVRGISIDKPGDQFVGLASIEPRNGVNREKRNFIIPTQNPDSLYFNIFVYGIEDDNVAMFIKFMQDDDGNGSHESDRENGFEMQLKDFSHSGWKKFSFPYSSVPLGGNTNFGGNGDGIHRPGQIVKIELGLWALKDPSQQVQFIYDYAVFTADKPFGE